MKNTKIFFFTFDTLISKVLQDTFFYAENFLEFLHIFQIFFYRTRISFSRLWFLSYDFNMKTTLNCEKLHLHGLGYTEQRESLLGSFNDDAKLK